MECLRSTVLFWQNNAMDWDKSLLETLASTIERLQSKRDKLDENRKEYDQLARSLAAAKAHQNEVHMVHLGGDYFAQMSHEDAQKFLERRQKQLESTLADFDSQLVHGRETMSHLTKFEEVVKKEEESQNATEQKSNDKSESDQKAVNEEGLPFVDIVEELDEDGNVIGAKLNDESVEVNALGKDDENGSGDIEMTSPEVSEIKAIQKNSEPKVQELIHDDSDSNGLPHQQHIDDEDAKQEISELISDMELVETPSEQIQFANTLLDKIDELEISADDKFRLKQACMDQLSQRRSIDPNDVYEFEMFDQMANEDEDEDMSGEFGEDWDIEFNDEDEDDEDAETDEGDEEVKFFKQHDRGNSMLWDQIQKLRDAKKNTANKDDTVEIADSKPKKSKKKGVKFADKVDVVPIENVSEEMKNMNIGRVSRFKMARNRHKETSFGDSAADGTKTESPVSDIIENENPVSDIIENEHPVSDIVENEHPLSDISENEVSKSSSDDPISDIIERDDGTLNDVVTMPIMSTDTKKMPTISRRTMEKEILDDTESPVEAFRFNTEAELKPNKSRFKQAMANKKSKQTSKKAHSIPPIIHTSESSSIKKADVEESETGKDEPKVVKLDFGGDLDAMAQAYVMGMYDDADEHGVQPDIDATRGDYVISSVDDLEKHNQVVELGQGRTADQGEDFAYMDDPEESDSDEENAPIISDDIMENEWEPSAMDVDGEEDYGLSNSVLGQEVKQDYHKMRQKFAYENEGTQQSDADKELEPVYAEGERKPSRFKLMRMKMT